jgi:hypothetical protein
MVRDKLIERVKRGYYKIPTTGSGTLSTANTSKIRKIERSDSQPTELIR